MTGVEVRQEKANPYVVDEHLTRPTTTVATLAADATSYTVTGLTEVRRYTYRIRLITNGQGHADSQPVTISKIPNPRPPTGLAASNATSSTVDLSWTLPEQPEGVSVRGIRVWQEVDQEPEPRPSSSHSPTAFDFPHTAWLSSTMLGADTTSHTVTGLTPETEYRFKISLDLDIDGATNVDGGGPANRWSKPVGVTTLAATNPATGLTASNPTQTTVDLAWTLPTQATGVTVTSVEVQQQAADESWATVATLAADATSHPVTGLTAGTAYSFRIRLVTSSGNADSEPVETQSLQTLLEAKMAGTVPPAQGRDGLEFSLSRSTGGGPAMTPSSILACACTGPAICGRLRRPRSKKTRQAPSPHPRRGAAEGARREARRPQPARDRDRSLRQAAGHRGLVARRLDEGAGALAGEAGALADERRLQGSDRTRLTGPACPARGAGRLPSRRVPRTGVYRVAAVFRAAYMLQDRPLSRDRDCARYADENRSSRETSVGKRSRPSSMRSRWAR